MSFIRQGGIENENDRPYEQAAAGERQRGELTVGREMERERGRGLERQVTEREVYRRGCFDDITRHGLPIPPLALHYAIRHAARAERSECPVSRGGKQKDSLGTQRELFTCLRFMCVWSNRETVSKQDSLVGRGLL